MIGKQTKGKSYRGASEYLMNGTKGALPDRGIVLDKNLTGDTPRAWAKEIAAYRRLRPSLGKAVYHASLSPADGDRELTDDEWKAIGQSYLEGMGFRDCPFVAVLHRETGRPHLHLLALRIRPDGSVVSDANDYRRSETVIRQIERDWRLTEVVPSRSQKQKKEPSMDPTYNPTQQAYIESLLAAHASDADTMHAAPSLEVAEPNERRRREYKRQLLEEAYRKAVEDTFLDQVRYVRATGNALSISTKDGGRLQDDGDRVVAYAMPDDVAALRLIELCMLKGFESIVLRGSDAFLLRAMTLARQKGLCVSPIDEHQLRIWSSICGSGGNGGAPAAPAAAEPAAKRGGLDLLAGPGKFSERLRRQRDEQEDGLPQSPVRPGLPRRPR